MADGLSALAARLRAVPQLGRVIAAEAAPLVEEAAKRTASAGTTPDGDAWAPRKKDGTRALVNAADAISARASGETVIVVLSGVNVYQNAKRRIIPREGEPVPPAYAAAIDEAASRVLRRSL